MADKYYYNSHFHPKVKVFHSQSVIFKLAVNWSQRDGCYVSYSNYTKKYGYGDNYYLKIRGINGDDYHVHLYRQCDDDMEARECKITFYDFYFGKDHSDFSIKSGNIRDIVDSLMKALKAHYYNNVE